MRGLAVTRDGRFIAAGGSESEVVAWEVATGKRLATFEGHSSWITSVAFSADGAILASGSRDTTILLWDLAPDRPGDAPGGDAVEMAAQALERFWKDLAGEDPAAGYRAVRGFGRAGERGLAFLRERLALPPLTEERFRELLGDLGSDAFQARDRAARAIRVLHVRALPRIDDALQESLHPEARARLASLRGQLFSTFTSFPSEALRRRRAIHALELHLELQGSESAREALRGIATGSPHPDERAEAERALAAD